MSQCEAVLDNVSNIVTSNTVDTLPNEYEGVSLSWESSNNNLYTISDGKGFTSRRYQTHRNQLVTITLTCSNGVENTVYTKEVTINPVLFDEMTNPKTTYFAIGSASSYMSNNARYKADGTLFSDKFRENIDMVYYAFAIPQNDGTLTLNTTHLEKVLALKNDGIRVLLVIDGANSAPLTAMVDLCNNDITRSTFVNNIMNLVLTYNFDGVDIDWEFPGTKHLSLETDRNNLNKLLRDLRQKFNENQDENGSDYILSIAAPSTYWGNDRYDYDGRFNDDPNLGGINDYVDYVNMMSYDLNKQETASHLTHLYKPNNSYSYKFSVEYGVEYFTSLGLDSNKIIIGSAAYGKAYSVTGASLDPLLPGLGATASLIQIPSVSGSFTSGTIYYTGIKELIDSGNYVQYNEYNSGNLVGSYLYNSSENIFITYESVESMVAKCNYANANGFGIMIWAYGEDATDTIVHTMCDNLN